MPGHFGLATPRALTMAMYHGRVSQRRIGELSPVVFAAAMEGDEAARAIVDRLADEVVAMAGAMIRRLRLTRNDPEVVLGGGVFRTPDEAFVARIEAGVQAIARRARLVRSKAPPVAGAALLGLDAGWWRDRRLRRSERRCARRSPRGTPRRSTPSSNGG